MNATYCEMSYRVKSNLCLLTAFALLLNAAPPASAQWDAANTKAAWEGFNSAFKYTQYGYDEHYGTTIKSQSPDAFWIQAEEMEMAEDAYNWAITNDNSELTYYEQVVEGLADGFVQLYHDSTGGGSWAAEDTFNDDLNVATIAFARAYNITGTARWLQDAEDANAAVWGRARADQLPPPYTVDNGGLCENSASPSDCYENSSANWTFVIASYFLYGATTNTTYLTQGNGVYNWAQANLYQASSGQVYDAYPKVVGPNSYNYGYAVGAATYEGDSTTATGATYYLMHRMGNYNPPQVNGYNILPFYSPNYLKDNDGGFNGIALRWTSLAYRSNMIPSLGGYLDWAQTNVSQAWSIREYSSQYPYYLMQGNWQMNTPNNTSDILAWECTNGVVGMLVIPSPN